MLENNLRIYEITFHKLLVLRIYFQRVKNRVLERMLSGGGEVQVEVWY